MFGPAPARALEMADNGATREDIQTATTHVLGVHDCTLEVEEGEILVLMGLSGSGKSTLLRAVNGLNPVARGSVEVQADGGRMVDVTNADAKTLRDIRQTPRRHGVPGLRPAALAHGAGECRLRSGAVGDAGGRTQCARGPPAQPRGPVRLGRAQGGGAVGRHAAARGPCPRVCHRCTDPLDGRAVFGARPADPHQAAGRASGPAARPEAYDHLRQPRSGRGFQDRQSHRHHGRRAHRAMRHPARHLLGARQRLRGGVRGQHEPAGRADPRGT